MVLFFLSAEMRGSVGQQRFDSLSATQAAKREIKMVDLCSSGIVQRLDEPQLDLSGAKLL